MYVCVLVCSVGSVCIAASSFALLTSHPPSVFSYLSSPVALQMNTKFLPDFVKQELYVDFGVHCVKIWQLLLLWRNEKQNFIEEQYDLLFAKWTPIELEPALQLPYMAKIKLPTLNKK
jgi:hypothetical protein